MADISVTAASVVASATATKNRSLIAGETITAGMPVYQFSLDSKLYKALSDTAAHAAVVGIALNGASAGQPLDIVTKDTSLTIGGTTAVGQAYVVSGSAGGISPIDDLASAEWMCLVGVGRSSNKLAVDFTSARLCGDVIQP